jgi:hypothetical protein
MINIFPCCKAGIRFTLDLAFLVHGAEMQNLTSKMDCSIGSESRYHAMMLSWKIRKPCL